MEKKIRATIEEAAASVDVPVTAVDVSYGCPCDEWEWTVSISLWVRPHRARKDHRIQASGSAADLAEAARLAVEDVAVWRASHAYRAGPVE